MEHVNIPEDGLHEPKGVSTAPSGRVYVSDGAGSGAWQVPPLVGQAGALERQQLVIVGGAPVWQDIPMGLYVFNADIPASSGSAVYATSLSAAITGETTIRESGNIPSWTDGGALLSIPLEDASFTFRVEGDSVTNYTWEYYNSTTGVWVEVPLLQLSDEAALSSGFRLKVNTGFSFSAYTAKVILKRTS